MGAALALRIFVLQRMYLPKAWNNTLIEGNHRNDFKFIKFGYFYFNTKVCYQMRLFSIYYP